jgi:hypothetical protein
MADVICLAVLIIAVMRESGQDALTRRKIGAGGRGECDDPRPGQPPRSICGGARSSPFGYLDRGDAVGAVTAMCSGIRRHSGTANHAGLPLLVMLAAEWRLAGHGELRKFIEEFR